MKQKPRPVSLWRVTEGDRHDYVDVFPSLTDAIRRSRIEYRTGARHEWMAADCASGHPVRQWVVVGDPDRAHGADCVETWPCQPDPTPPTAPASCMALPTVRNRVGYLLQRLGRKEAA